MLDIKVSAALLGYTQEEQRIILSCFREQKEAPTARLRKGVDLVTDVYENHVEVVEGYAGFPIDKNLIDKNKQTFKDDRNIGRVVTMGGNSMVITGKKSDGRYSVVGKKGEKTAKRPEDLGLNFQREHIDIEDLHQMMVEKMDGKDDNGFKSCWKGYKKQGTKMKGGKEVNDCVKEATAMAKRGHDETAIRNKIAKSTGGGKSADRATKLADKPTFGQSGVDTKARQNLARKQRGDFRKTTSSSPGLHGYGHKSDDPKVKAKQAARGAQRGALTPNEKKQLNREEFEIWVNALVNEGYDLSDYTWDEMYEFYLDEALTGERYKKAVKKPGGTAYSRMVSADPKKRATRGGRGGESDFGAGDRGSGNKAARRAGTYQEEFEAFIEEFIDFSDPELDTLTFEELEEICTEALLELDGEVLTEALEFIDGMDLLTEVMDRKEIQRRRDQAKDRLATSSAMKSAASKPAPKQRDAGAEARQRLTSKSSSDASPASGARREKVKAALKTAGSAIKKGLSATKSAAKKAVGGASEVAGAAAGGFRKGYSDARGKSEPKRSDSGSQSSERVSGSSSSSSSSSTSGGEGRVRLRDRLKSGIKKAIGSAARVVSRKARSVARRLGEEQQLYSWREEMGVGE